MTKPRQIPPARLALAEALRTRRQRARLSLRGLALAVDWPRDYVEDAEDPFEPLLPPRRVVAAWDSVTGAKGALLALYDEAE
ncbi:helix-turn-helix domain-containing protein [Frankia sp. AgB1.9]|uniref:helix-turn-helix domain-containing protein n=1 Tax=unclassified Frankia TaxID=2632575 RepID=UPI0019348D96|nr:MULTISPECIES: helix-turn-helix domain-containing protein [unclassified Frankia]MBL7494367.1 helix-turn-helix domain-containing protein [Frankia sp. AgW1.1]MBL7551385.1 helix-turn-helix domain-containing protein [Frankia sp. AgB1.9]MBL7620720.1 helix-turn-helix domain-containing protein [Frankia sp. AgB1.8]